MEVENALNLDGKIHHLNPCFFKGTFQTYATKINFNNKLNLEFLNSLLLGIKILHKDKKHSSNSPILNQIGEHDDRQHTTHPDEVGRRRKRYRRTTKKN